MTELRLPELGEGIESGDVVAIRVAAGDHIDAGETVIEVETDKATIEVPSESGGRVLELRVALGEKIAPGAVLLTLDLDEEAAPSPEATPARNAEPEPELEPEPEPEPSPPPEPPAPRAALAVFAAPSVRQLARELGIDIHQVSGSGPGGRISKDDVKEHARRRVTAGGSATPPPPLPDFARWGAVTREKLSNVRRATARRMALAWSTVPHVTLHQSADITEIETLRKRYRARAEAIGGNLTITAIMLKVTAAALKVHRVLNASLDLENDEVVYKGHFHLGVAADTDRGLLVPVVRDVDQKNILELSVELTELSARARAGKLTPDEMNGATFTLTNLGGIGVGSFTPIVNPPQVAILGIGRARDRPVRIAGSWVPRRVMPLSLSFDHRLVDGADGARFLKWICEAIESPLLLAMEG